MFLFPLRRQNKAAPQNKTETNEKNLKQNTGLEMWGLVKMCYFTSYYSGQRIVKTDAVFIYIVVMAIVRAIVEGCYTDICHSMSVNPL